jgi:hypothetical protein
LIILAEGYWIHLAVSPYPLATAPWNNSIYTVRKESCSLIATGLFQFSYLAFYIQPVFPPLNLLDVSRSQAVTSCSFQPNSRQTAFHMSLKSRDQRNSTAVSRPTTVFVSKGYSTVNSCHTQRGCYTCHCFRPSTELNPLKRSRNHLSLVFPTGRGNFSG